MQTRLLALAFTSLTLVACDDPADAVPAATTNAPETAAQETAAPETEAPAMEALPINVSASSVGFTGSKVTGSHTGSFGEFSGTLHLQPNEISAGRVEITIQMASVTTDAERLTGHLKSDDFFDVAQFATSTFTSNQIVIAPSDEAGGPTHRISGDLTLHGQTQSISFPAKITVSDGDVRAEAEFSIKRTDFGIVYPGMQDDLIRDDVVIRFNVVAPRS